MGKTLIAVLLLLGAMTSGGKDAFATIATVPDSLEGWEANARLIAAAPDLLAALETLLAEYQNMVHENRQDSFLLETADNAIARAKGLSNV